MAERRDNRKALPVEPFGRPSVEPRENDSELTCASLIRFRALEALRYPRCILLRHPASTAGFHVISYLGAVWDVVSFCKPVLEVINTGASAFNGKQNHKILRWFVQLLIPLIEPFFNEQNAVYIILYLDALKIGKKNYFNAYYSKYLGARS